MRLKSGSKGRQSLLRWFSKEGTACVLSRVRALPCGLVRRGVRLSHLRLSH